MGLELETLQVPQLDGLAQVVGNELQRKRRWDEVENLKDEFGNKIYSLGSLHKTTYNHPEIFSTKDYWTLAQIIDYAYIGQSSPQKINVIEYAKRLKNPEVDSYIEERESSRKKRLAVKQQIQVKPDISDAEHMQLEALRANLYLTPHRISEITGFDAPQLLEFAESEGIESLPCGPGRLRALNLKTLIPFLLNGRKYETKAFALYNAYIGLLF